MGKLIYRGNNSVSSVSEKTTEPYQPETSINPSEETIDARRDYFLSIKSISDFHYLDEDRIKKNLNAMFKEPVIVDLFISATNNKRFNLNAEILRVLGSKIKEREIIKWISSQQIPGTSIREMYLRYQKELIQKQRVYIGLEVVDPLDIDQKSIKLAERHIKAIKSLGFSLQENEIDDYIKNQKKSAAYQALEKLTSMTLKGKEVLIHGRFEISDDGDEFELTYIHPVSRFLNTNIYIRTIGIKKADVTYQKEYRKKIGKKLALNLYGEVFEPLDLEGGENQITLKVFGIY